MSAESRKWASDLSRAYARTFKVAIEDVRTEFRDDEDDVEVWAPGVGEVWTRGCEPYESTMRSARGESSPRQSEGRPKEGT